MGEGKGTYGPVALAASDAVAGVLSLANPEGVDLLIPAGGFVLDVTTKTTGACTLDAGIDTDGTGTADTLIDGVDVNAAVGVFDNGADKGTNGGAMKWGASEYITVSKKTGASAGLVGNAYINYIRE
jgi:hypothetical protein